MNGVSTNTVLIFLRSADSVRPALPHWTALARQLGALKHDGPRSFWRRAL